MANSKDEKKEEHKVPVSMNEFENELESSLEAPPDINIVLSRNTNEMKFKANSNSKGPLKSQRIKPKDEKSEYVIEKDHSENLSLPSIKSAGKITNLEINVINSESNKAQQNSSIPSQSKKNIKHSGVKKIIIYETERLPKQTFKPKKVVLNEKYPKRIQELFNNPFGLKDKRRYFSPQSIHPDENGPQFSDYISKFEPKRCSRVSLNQTTQTQSMQRIESMDRTRMQFIDQSSSDSMSKLLRAKEASSKENQNDEQNESYEELLNSLFGSLSASIAKKQAEKELPIFALPAINTSNLDCSKGNISSRSNSNHYQQVIDSKFDVTVLENNQQVNQPILDYISHLKKKLASKGINLESDTKIDSKEVLKVAQESGAYLSTEYWLPPRKLENKDFKMIEQPNQATLPYSSTSLLEQIDPQKQAEIFSRLELNQKMRILADLVYKLENGLLM